MKNLDKVVFITGASSGIGEALAREYLKNGAKVALCARRKERLDQLVQEFPQRALAIACDVCSSDSLQAAVMETLKAFGRIDVVIANAGYGVASRIEKLSLDDYRKQFDTNVFAVVDTVQKTLEELKKTKGTLVLMGSANSYISEPKKTPYCMSKFAVRALAEGLYWELEPQGVAVTLICPGLIESEIRKVSKDGTYDENAKDPAPAFLIMPKEKAAKQMLAAIERRKKEVVITYHAKLGVWLQRHLPCTLSVLFKGGKIFSRANK